MLADALAAARTMDNPDLLIDLATLTGAARTALGPGPACVFGPDQALARRLRELAVRRPIRCGRCRCGTAG